MCPPVFAFGGAIDDIPSLRRLKYDPPPNRLPLPIAISQPQTSLHHPSLPLATLLLYLELPLSVPRARLALAATAFNRKRNSSTVMIVTLGDLFKLGIRFWEDLL